MLLPFNPHPLHSTKEIRGHPFFQGAISRWAWRLYTHRLTRPGVWFLGMTGAFALYGATSLDLQVFVPFTYAAGIWLAALLAAQAFPPRMAHLTARHAGRIEAGQLLVVAMELEARRTVYDAVLLPRRLPPAIDSEPLEGVALGALRPGQGRRVQIGLRCARRGQFTLRGWRVQSDFPFGMLRAYTLIDDEQTLLVTPQFTPLTEFSLPLQRSNQPGGAALSSARGASLEFIGDREFREGDSIRDIDWRATARLDRLVVREFREEYFHHIALVLDTRAGNDAAFEGAVSLCAAISDFFARQQYVLDCLAVGPTCHALGGTAHERVLDILATCAASSERVWAAPAELSERLERISVAVCLFLDWTEERRVWAAGVAQSGTALRILIIRDTPPTLVPETDYSVFGDMRIVTSAQIDMGLSRL